MEEQKNGNMRYKIVSSNDNKKKNEGPSLYKILQSNRDALVSPYFDTGVGAINSFKRTEALQLTAFMFEALGLASSSDATTLSDIESAQKAITLRPLTDFMGFRLLFKFLFPSGQTPKESYGVVRERLFNPDKFVGISFDDLVGLFEGLESSYRKRVENILYDEGYIAFDSSKKIVPGEGLVKGEADLTKLLFKFFNTMNQEDKLWAISTIKALDPKKGVDKTTFTKDYAKAWQLLLSLVLNSKSVTDMNVQLLAAFSKDKMLELLYQKMAQSGDNFMSKLKTFSAVASERERVSVLDFKNSVMHYIKGTEGLKIAPNAKEIITNLEVVNENNLKTRRGANALAAKAFLNAKVTDGKLVLEKSKFALIINNGGYGTRLQKSPDSPTNNKNTFKFEETSNTVDIMQNSIDIFVELYRTRFLAEFNKVPTPAEVIDATKDFFQNKYKIVISSNVHFAPLFISDLLVANTVFKVDGKEYSFKDIFCDKEGNAKNIEICLASYHNPMVHTLHNTKPEILTKAETEGRAFVIAERNFNNNQVRKIYHVYGTKQEAEAAKTGEKTQGDVAVITEILIKDNGQDTVQQSKYSVWAREDNATSTIALKADFQGQKGHIEGPMSWDAKLTAEEVKKHGYGGGYLKVIENIGTKLKEISTINEEFSVPLAKATEDFAKLVDAGIINVDERRSVNDRLKADGVESSIVMPGDKGNLLSGDRVGKMLMFYTSMKAKNIGVAVMAGPANPKMSNQGGFLPVVVTNEKTGEETVVMLAAEGGARKTVLDEAASESHGLKFLPTNINVWGYNPQERTEDGNGNVVMPEWAKPLLAFTLDDIKKPDADSHFYLAQGMAGQKLIIEFGKGKVIFLGYSKDEMDNALKSVNNLGDFGDVKNAMTLNPLKKGKAYDYTAREKAIGKDTLGLAPWTNLKEIPTTIEKLSKAPDNHQVPEDSMLYAIEMSSEDLESLSKDSGLGTHKLEAVLQGIASNENLGKSIGSISLIVSEKLKDGTDGKTLVGKRLKEYGCKEASENGITYYEFTANNEKIKIYIGTKTQTYKLDDSGSLVFKSDTSFPQELEAMKLDQNLEKFILNIYNNRDKKIFEKTVDQIQKLQNSIKNVGVHTIGTDPRSEGIGKRESSQAIINMRRVLKAVHETDWRGWGTGKMKTFITIRDKSEMDRLKNRQNEIYSKNQGSMTYEEAYQIASKEIGAYSNSERLIMEEIEIKTWDPKGAVEFQEALKELSNKIKPGGVYDPKEYEIGIKLQTTPSGFEDIASRFHWADDIINALTKDVDGKEVRIHGTDIVDLAIFITQKDLGSSVAELINTGEQFNPQAMYELFAGITDTNKRDAVINLINNAMTTKTRKDMVATEIQGDIEHALFKAVGTDDGPSLLDVMNDGSEAHKYIQMMKLQDVPNTESLLEYAKIATANTKPLIFTALNGVKKETLNPNSMILAGTKLAEDDTPILLAYPNGGSQAQDIPGNTVIQNTSMIAHVGAFRNFIAQAFTYATENTMGYTSQFDNLNAQAVVNGVQQKVWSSAIPLMLLNYGARNMDEANKGVAVYLDKPVSSLVLSNVEDTFVNGTEGDERLEGFGAVIKFITNKAVNVSEDGVTTSQTSEAIRTMIKNTQFNNGLAINIDPSTKSLSLGILSKTELGRLENKNLGVPGVTVNLSGMSVKGRGKESQLRTIDKLSVTSFKINGDDSEVQVSKLADILQKNKTISNFDLGEGFFVQAIIPTDTGKVTLIVENKNKTDVGEGSNQLVELMSMFKNNLSGLTTKLTDAPVNPTVLTESVAMLSDVIKGLNNKTDLIKDEAIKGYFINLKGTVPEKITDLFEFIKIKLLSASPTIYQENLKNLATELSKADVKELIASLGLNKFSKLLSIFDHNISESRGSKDVYKDVYNALVNFEKQVKGYYGAEVFSILRPLTLKYSNYKDASDTAKVDLTASFGNVVHSNVIPTDMVRGVKLSTEAIQSHENVVDSLRHYFPNQKTSKLTHEIQPDWKYSLWNLLFTDVTDVPENMKSKAFQIKDELDYRKVLSLIVLKNMGFSTTLDVDSKGNAKVYRDGYAIVDTSIENNNNSQSLENLSLAKLTNAQETIKVTYKNSVQNFLREAGKEDLMLVFTEKAAKDILLWRDNAGVLGKNAIDLSAFNLNGTADGKYKVIISSIPSLFQDQKMSVNLGKGTFETYALDSLNALATDLKTIDKKSLLLDMRGLLRPGTAKVLGEKGTGSSNAAFLCGVYYQLASNIKIAEVQ